MQQFAFLQSTPWALTTCYLWVKILIVHMIVSSFRGCLRSLLAEAASPVISRVFASASERNQVTGRLQRVPYPSVFSHISDLNLQHLSSEDSKAICKSIKHPCRFPRRQMYLAMFYNGGGGFKCCVTSSEAEAEMVPQCNARFLILTTKVCFAPGKHCVKSMPFNSQAPYNFTLSSRPEAGRAGALTLSRVCGGDCLEQWKCKVNHRPVRTQNSRKRRSNLFQG